MPLYTYQSISKKGKKHSGTIEATSLVEAKEKLRQSGVLVVSLSERTWGVSKGNFTREQLHSFTTQLAQLILAGVPIFESLVVMEEQYRGEKRERVLTSLCDQIKRGSSLSDAMETFPRSFNRLYCSMVRAGESIGALGTLLQKLSTLLAKQIQLKKELITAMVYPSVLALFACVVIGVLMGFVIPSIEEMFQDQEVGRFTALVIWTSRWLRNWFWLLLLLGGGVVTWAVYKVRTLAGRKWLERLLIPCPLIGTILIEVALARYCRTLETLLNGGLSMVEAMEIAREVMGNATLEKEIELAEKKVIQGGKLSQELAKSKYIPPLVSRMLAVGEEAGNLTPMLSEVATVYEESIEKNLSRTLALVQPVILLVMGGIIGVVLLAILLPMTNTSAFDL